MHKTLLFALVSLFFVNPTISQTDIKLVLEFKMSHIVDTNQRDNPRVSPCMLIAGASASVFDDYYKSKRFLGYSGRDVDRVYDNEFDMEDFINGISTDQVYTDFGKKELTSGMYINKILYTKTEPLPKIDWTIQSQTKTMLGQECQMATATFRGRRYTAWFAPGIAIGAGPWKLNGLPGIILAANDDRNEISFTCTKMYAPEKNAPSITINKNAVQLTAEQFDKRKKAFDKDPGASRPPSTDPRGSMVAMTVSRDMPTQPDGIRKKPKPRPLNNPIERE